MPHQLQDKSRHTMAEGRGILGSALGARSFPAQGLGDQIAQVLDQNHGPLEWIPNLESFCTHDVLSQNKGPYFKLHPNKETTGKGPS